MSAAIEAYYHTWESELTLLRTDDLLVNIDANRVLPNIEALWDHSPRSNQILRDYKKLKREQGIDALVLTQGLLHWQKGTKSLQTPVFLFDANKIQIDQKHIEFSEMAQLNPYIRLILKNEWNIDAPDNPDFEWVSQLVEKGIYTHFSTDSFIGNFHPQRYELRREWEALKNQNEFSPAILQVLGDFDQELLSRDPQPIRGQITPLDLDQKSAIELATTNSCVIYGPPGTGKSAVLSNFIAQVLFDQKKALVVSEKRGALEVIKHRLTQVGLGQYCLIAPTKNELGGFFQQLQFDFQNLLNVSSPALSPTFVKSNKARQYWQERNKIEQATQLPFEELLDSFGPKINHPKATISDRWMSWLHSRKYQAGIPESLLQILPKFGSVWAQKPFEELEKQWQEWQHLLSVLQDIFQLESSTDMEMLSKKSLICHQFQTQVFQKYARPLELHQNKLTKTLNAYLLKEKQIAQLEVQLSAWLQIPSLEEWPVLQHLAAAKGFFKKRKWNAIAKAWLRLPTVPIEQFDSAIGQYWQLKSQQQQNELKIAQFGIENPAQEVPILLQLLKQINWEQFNWYQALSQKERVTFLQYQTQVYRFTSLHRELFEQKTLDFTALQKDLTHCWELLRNHLNMIQKIPQEIWGTLSQDQQCSKELQEEFWAALRMNYPLLFQWDNPTWKAALADAINEEEQQQNHYAQAVKRKQIERFTALESLLNLPIRKLTEEQKIYRQTLRKGKALLVKEMAKTRQFSPLKNLLEGPAAPWLLAIYPVWLLNPTQVANSIPMSCSLFEYGLFDEASQLPLSHAIGALQRVETALIAGDPEQMRPSSYFSAQADGVIDLLHQAAFHLPKHLLHYHYRSEHPSLIAFSNRHFYNNELKTWPSLQRQKQAIFQHFIPNGIYHERQNDPEAKALAAALRKLLQHEDKIGVVAFSLQQLQCIYNNLNHKEQALLEEKINQRQAFFLALEQVQGEECDHLLISFGFGKNQNNEFNLRFGPMNQSQGGKRLNVLLTRARKSLHFYCSVKAADFPSKRSESVELIYQWFAYLENPKEEPSTYDAAERLASANDFDSYLHCYQVLQHRLALPDRV